MKTLLSMILLSASCLAAELRIPNSEFTFDYDSDEWSEITGHATPDVWAFTDKKLYSSSGIFRINVGTDQNLSNQQIGELVGGLPTLKEKKQNFTIFTIKGESKNTERWFSYYASGTLAYFVFVEAEPAFFIQNKTSVLKFLSGLQKKKT